MDVGVDHLDLARSRELTGGDLTRALGFEGQEGRLVAVDLERDLLEIEDDVGDVFDDTRHRRELMVGALDLDRRDGGTGNRRKQRPPQSIADGCAPTPFEGLRQEARECVAVFFFARLHLGRSLEFVPDHAASKLA